MKRSPLFGIVTCLGALLLLVAAMVGGLHLMGIFEQDSRAVSGVPLPVHVVSSESDFMFDVGTQTITGITWSAWSTPGVTLQVDIPSTIGGTPVLAIGDFAFHAHFSHPQFGIGSTPSIITGVTIPSGITNIGIGAFGMQLITSVDLPAGLTSLEENVFLANELTSITIPDSVTYIGNHAFSNNLLTTVTVPNNVTHIGNWAFANNHLTSVTIGNSVTSIGDGAFRNSTSTFGGNRITSVVIPDSVITIGEFAFWQNRNLASLTLGTGLTTIGNNAFSVNAISNLVIPNNVTDIGISAFSSNQISNLVISENLTTLQSNVFAANNLPSITIPNSVTIIGHAAFNSNNLTSIVIPNNVTSIGPNAFHTNQLVNVVIGNSVQTIGDSAFRNNSLTNLIIPDNVIEIQGAAFMDNQLDTVTLGSGLTVIGGVSWTGGAFMDNNLTSIVIPDSVTTIGSHAFMNNNLTSIVIPDSVTSIGMSAFRYNQLTSAILGSGIPYIPTSLFQGNQLTSIELPSGITSIGSQAFYQNSLFNVRIPDGVTNIGMQAFHNNALSWVTIPASVISISWVAFTCEGWPCHGATVLTEHESRPGGWDEYWDVSDFWDWTVRLDVVWGADLRPEITVTNPNGTATITTSTVGFTGSGTSLVQGEVDWASDVSLTLYHQHGIAGIRINGLFLPVTGPSSSGWVHNMAARASRAGTFGQNTITLGLGHIGRHLDIEILSVTRTVTLNRGYGSGGTAWFEHTIGETPDSITPPTRTGWDFLGYYTTAGVRIFNSDGTASVTDWVIHGDITLNAVWQRTLDNPVGIAFIAGGSLISWDTVHYASSYLVIINSTHTFTVSATFFDLASIKELIESNSYASLTITVTAIGDATGINRTLNSGESDDLVIQVGDLNWGGTQQGGGTHGGFNMWWLTAGLAAIGLLLALLALVLILKKRRSREEESNIQNS